MKEVNLFKNGPELCKLLIIYTSIYLFSFINYGVQLKISFIWKSYLALLAPIWLFAFPYSHVDKD